MNGYQLKYMLISYITAHIDFIEKVNRDTNTYYGKDLKRAKDFLEEVRKINVEELAKWTNDEIEAHLDL